jgi:hypothetical protein
MDISKLFGVLVLGGSLLVGCDDADPGEPDPADAATAQGPTGEDGGEAPEVADAGGEEGEDCGFCPNEICCEIDAEGQSTTRDGFVCCWGTTC